MSNVTVKLGKNQELSIIDKRGMLPRCFLLGETHMGDKVPDIMLNMSPSANKMFWELIKHRNRVTNIAKLDPITKTDKNRTSTAYKELNKLLFIKRIAPKTYIINPMLLPPYKDRVDSVQQVWDSLP